MKTLSKPPSINRNDYVATNPKKLSDGFNFKNDFIFSDELPYMRKKQNDTRRVTSKKWEV